MNEDIDITAGQRRAIREAARLGICNCGSGAPICPACDAWPPTCGHPACQPRTRRRTA